MKRQCFCIIGAGYGDEGKGLMTDYLTRKFTKDCAQPINVRFNGGGQAGHTVVSDIGRHVFSHVGAGSFAGASTYLSSNFIVNPIILKRELAELREMNIIPRIEVHPDCNVTTIFDIVLNSLRELSRGDKRHGSCGVGINETITRASAGYKLTVEDVLSGDLVKTVSEILINWWTPELFKIDFTQIDPEEGAQLMKLWDVDIAINALKELANLLPESTRFPDKNHGLKDVFVFEGAQGLELDEFLGEFPHVTRSQTGLEGALLTAANLGITEITPVYVTRVYKTRHGAGPLPYEGEKFSDKNIVDKTNVTGLWQGNFRYAPLNIPQLTEVINSDYANSKTLAERLRIKINQPEIAITWLDKVGKKIKFYGHFDEYYDFICPKELNIEDFMEVTGSYIDTRVRNWYLSYGETASTIKEILNDDSI